MAGGPLRDSVALACHGPWFPSVMRLPRRVVGLRSDAGGRESSGMCPEARLRALALRSFRSGTHGDEGHGYEKAGPSLWVAAGSHASVGLLANKCKYIEE
ncbi:hypothetical protein GCM10011578_019000 [Streptomyces fuscichromogenes]|uniref:Uncharacterized protein n=1 Tax=Streptomyces fuscichromogenes TaxID=1324013 RepID=A0A917X9R5_9ACTN|nr:hypothetical protein GCM10011578_019000 [Streptomyces fuscichromogenes]